MHGMNMRRWLVLPVLLLASRVATASVVEIPLDVANTSVDVTVCVLGSCDSDASPATGLVRLDLDSISAPTSATLLDFSMALTESIDIYVSLGLLGSLTAYAPDVTLAYATPGTPNGPVPLVGGDASFPSVPVQLDGSLDYDATGVVCSLMQGAGYPCSSVLDLGTTEPDIADPLVMHITSQNRGISVQSVVQVTVPLDPNNPGLGDTTVLATLNGSVYVPCPADLNGDGAVDLDDLSQLLVHFGQPGPLSYEDGDLDDDDDVDLDDLSILLVNFGQTCD